MKGLKKYLHNREKAINLLLAIPARSFTPATFHELRVEIKKLNAFYKLIDFCSKDFKRKKAIRPFRQIFHQAGKVREIQVELVLLKKYLSDTILIGYRKYLRVRRLKERAFFFSLLNDSFIARVKKSFSDTIPVLTLIDKKKVGLYFKEKRNKILKNFIQYDLQPDQIHELRKQLKCYYYNKSAVEKGIPSSTSGKQAQLSDLLGKWHDSNVISVHLKKAMATEGFNPEDVAQIERIEELISSENLVKLHQIKIAIAGFNFSEAP